MAARKEVIIVASKSGLLIMTVLFVSLFAVGCATMKKDWKVARSADTIQAHEEFLQKHPQGELAGQIRVRVEAMRRDLPDWEKTLETNMIEAYTDFLKIHPNSPFADKAKGKIIDLEVSDIMHGKYNQLPSPNRISGGGRRTYSVVNIHNGTSYNLTIRYSGPESFKVIFSPEEKGSIEILKGNYRVAASVDAADVNSYAGEKTYDGGNYKVKYYIVTTGPFGFTPPIISLPKISLPGVYYGRTQKFEPWPNKRRVPEYLK